MEDMGILSNHSRNMTNNMIKLVIIHPSQLIARTVEFFCLDKLSQSFDLEYWDCSAIVYPSFTSSHQIERDYVKLIKSLKQFQTEMSKLPSDTLVISAIDVNSYNYGLHRILTSYIKTKTYIDFFGVGDMQGSNINSKFSITKKLKSILYRSENIRQFIKWYKHHKEESWGDLQSVEQIIKMYDYTFTIGVTPRFEYRINHPDYEKYVSAKDIMGGKEYVVFLDQYFPLHPEWQYRFPELRSKQIQKDYYDSLNTFFSKVEEYYHCKVVIAAHPYADYEENNPFNGREVFVYKTPELVKYAKAVCMHDSCAISYIMLADKPVCVMNNKSFGRVESIYAGLQTQQNLIKIPITDIEQCDNIEGVFLHINQDIREKYIQRFLHDKNNQQSNAELLKSYLMDIYNRIQNKDYNR